MAVTPAGNGSSSADPMSWDPLCLQDRVSPVSFEPRMSPGDLSLDASAMGPDAGDLLPQGNAEIVEEVVQVVSAVMELLSKPYL